MSVRAVVRQFSMGRVDIGMFFKNIFFSASSIGVDIRDLSGRCFWEQCATDRDVQQGKSRGDFCALCDIIVCMGVLCSY